METFSNNNWSNLPVHKPNADLWDKIETDLDVEVITNNFDKLPKHNPNMDLWRYINRNLFLKQYIRYFYITGAAVASTFLVYLFFLNKEKTNNITLENNFKQKNTLVINNNRTDIYKIKKEETINNIIQKNIKETKKHTSEIKNTIIKNEVLINIISNKKNKESKEHYNAKKTTKASKLLSLNENNVQNINTKDKVTIATTVNDIKRQIDNPEQNNTIENTKNLIKSDTTAAAIKTLNDNNTEPPKIPLAKLDLAKSSTEKQWYYSIGADYSYNLIKNNNKFSYTDTKKISDYGITGKVTYANWILQTGIAYSSFNDKIKYDADVNIDKYITYQYVDSVIYSPSSGAIYQYITHPVTINDSIITKIGLYINKKYSMLNIPILVGYQWRINRIGVALKTGVQCSVIISETEEQQELGKNISLLELNSTKAIIRRTNWAGIVSAEIGYNFYKHLEFYVEPQIHYYFNTMYKEMDSNTGLPYTIGVKTGIFYNF